MARSRKSKKSTDKPEEGADVTENPNDSLAGAPEDLTADPVDTSTDAEPDKAEASADEAGETAELSTDQETSNAVTSETEEQVTVEANSDEADRSVAEPEESSASDDETVEDQEVQETDQAAKDEDHGADLGDDTLESDEAVEAASEETLPGLEETLSEEDDKSLSDEADVADASDKDEAEPAAEPEAVPAPVAAAPAQQRGSSFWPAVFGGVVAALLGFIAGRGDTLDGFLPGSMQRQGVDLTQLETETAALAQSNVDLLARLEALEAVEPVVSEPVDTTALTDGLGTMEAAIAALNSTLADLTERVGALEDQPADAAPSEEVASSEDLAELQAALEAQQAEIANLTQLAADAEAAAASEARRILAKAALTGVVAAVNTGEPFTPALQDLEDSVAVDVPEPLRVAAETGVPTMAELQDSFPDAARAGLAAARAEVPESEVQGITGFLRRQLNARSVVPREGDDPNAVLSRAEAALRNSDLSTALMETETLPDASKAAMSDWLEAASARKAAQDAADTLADSLNSN